eukprot:451011-Hanusia_phi.AAC.1
MITGPGGRRAAARHGYPDQALSHGVSRGRSGTVTPSDWDRESAAGSGVDSDCRDRTVGDCP